MSAPDGTLTQRTAPPGAAAVLAGCAAVGLVAAVAVFGVLPVWQRWPLTGTAAVLTSVAWAATAVLVATEPGHRRTGLLFLVVGLGWAAEWLDNRDHGPFPLLAYLSAPCYLTAGAIAVLRYTAERPLSAGPRAFGVAVAAGLIGGRAGTAVTSEPARFGYRADVWWPTLSSGTSAYPVISTGYWLAGAVLAAGFVVLLARNLRHAAHLDRWLLAPLMSAAFVTVATIAIRIPWRLLHPSATTPAALVAAQTFGLLLAPLGFLVTSARRRFAPATVADLVLRLAGPVSGGQLRDALRSTLREPGLDVFYPVPGTGRYVDGDGHDADLSTVPPGRTAYQVMSTDGAALAVVLASPALAAHPRLLDAALSASRLALENAQLAALAAAQLEQIRTARRGLVQAGDAERRRIERDLHDGVQQRLVALTMRLSQGCSGAADPATRRLLHQARAELHEALRELRDLTHGIYPATLTVGGLRAAVTDLAGRVPVAVTVDVPVTRWPPEVEAAAYFVIAEALTNTVKHANAETARVRVTASGPELRVDVADDGRGGAVASAGGGLAGLLDRIRALGGDLTVDGRHGTAVTAVIPLQRQPVGGR